MASSMRYKLVVAVGVQWGAVGFVAGEVGKERGGCIYNIESSCKMALI